MQVPFYAYEAELLIAHIALPPPQFCKTLASCKLGQP